MRRQHHLVAPALASLPAVDFQIVGGRGDDIGNQVDHVAPPVAVEIDREALERGRHELRRAEGAGPGADQAVGRDVAALQDVERGEELLAEIVAAAADAGERRRRAENGALAAHGAVIRFDAPDRRDNVAVDAIGALGGGEYRRVLRQEFAAAGDALVADQRVEIVPGRFVEFRLGIEQVHDAQIRRQPGGIALEIGAADAAAFGLRPQRRDAIAEVGGGGADCFGRHQRMAGGARLPAPLARSARRRGNRGRCRRLKEPGQPVVGLVLRLRRRGQAGAEKGCRGEAKDRLQSCHDRSSRLRLQSSKLQMHHARSICGRTKGHLLCYRNLNAGARRGPKSAFIGRQCDPRNPSHRLGERLGQRFRQQSVSPRFLLHLFA